MERISKEMSESERIEEENNFIHRFVHNLSVGDVTLRNFAIQTRGDLVRRFDVESVRKQLASNKRLVYIGS
jgi:hypothetical protein